MSCWKVNELDDDMLESIIINERKSIEEFREQDFFYSGDRYYQDMLEELSALEEEAEERGLDI